MTVELVVAHYQEDLSWLREVEADRITVYHKGGLPTPDQMQIPWDRWQMMENRGREASAYLHHIIRQYEALSDVTIFSQGDPRPHVRLPLLVEACRSMPLPGIKAGFIDLARAHATDDGDGRPNHHFTLPLGELYFRAFGRHGPPSYEFGAGACFAVSRECIQSKYRGWWARLLDICEHDYPAVYPWCLERLWPRLFLDPLEER